MSTALSVEAQRGSCYAISACSLRSASKPRGVKRSTNAIFNANDDEPFLSNRRSERQQAARGYLRRIGHVPIPFTVFRRSSVAEALPSEAAASRNACPARGAATGQKVFGWPLKQGA